MKKLYFKMIFFFICYLSFDPKWNIDLYINIWIFMRKTSPHYEEHLSRNMLKSLDACGSYAPDTGLRWPSSVPLTFERRTWVSCATHHIIMVNICTKLFCYRSKNEQDIDRTNPNARTDADTHTPKYAPKVATKSSSPQADSTKILD
jgi:hypothetical protein